MRRLRGIAVLPLLASVLAACGGGETSGPVGIDWYNFPDDSGALQKAAARCSKASDGHDFTGAEYTGAGKPVDADWSAFTSLALWLRGDGSANGGALRIVAGGVDFWYQLPLSDTSGQEVRAPFSEFTPAPWDTDHAGAVLDTAHLAEVTAFHLYLVHGSGAATKGVVYVDDIRAE